MSLEEVPITTFPQRVMSLLDDEDIQQSCMHWLPSGKAFEIHNPVKFEEVLKTHFNSIKLESFVIRLTKWGFTRIDEKINSRYTGYTFASEYFQRDSPELVARMKLQNRREKKLQEKKLQEKLQQAERLVGVANPKKAKPAVGTPVPTHPVVMLCPYPVSQMMMLVPQMTVPVLPRRQVPTYPPPPQKYQQWNPHTFSAPLPSDSLPTSKHIPSRLPPEHLPTSTYIPPPPQPHVAPSIIYQGPAMRQISPDEMHPPQVQVNTKSVPAHVLQPSLLTASQSPPPTSKLVQSNKRAKINSPPQNKTRTENKKIAEAAVAMMGLAGCNFSFQGKDVKAK